MFSRLMLISCGHERFGAFATEIMGHLHQDPTDPTQGSSRTPQPSPGPPSSSLGVEDVLRQAFKYQDALVSYAYGLLQDWALAQDAVQEAFIVLQRKHQELRPGSNVFTWARQIVRFEVLNLLRSRQKETCFVDDELFSLVDQQFEKYLDADSVSQLESRKAALQYCLGRLDEPSRGLLLGFYRDALSCEKLSEVTQRSVNAIRLSLSRIRAKLRDCVRHQLALTEVRS